MAHELLSSLANKEIVFSDVLAYIAARYEHSPTAFTNGDQVNEETENQGSAKILAFATLNNLDKEQTLALFAEHYEAVLNDPEGDNHQNIRQFMLNGWDGVSFSGVALTLK
ncbi:HopJ type III effector protein [Sphingobacterium faecium]|uniref:HopJ type III effector protein n=1 Tax=Sphingobacterium faecium TaxID=34087 RepID=UPI00097EE00D|nr:HopJ type III effector protein [Sphingobacterium faecium]WGQ14667.1 HopJ type III effector protein [Sphingobacterium faecium]SJN43552.1 Type III effector HopPmaJ [Sphingobacterium faecium PCAi_F2.5]